MTPTRHPASIKWFQLAQLVGTPSPTSSAARAVEHVRRVAMQGGLSISSPMDDLAGGSTTPGLGKFQATFLEESVLGSGEFSEVVKAVDRTSGVAYAVKRMKAPFRGQLDRRRLMEEVQVMQHLQQRSEGEQQAVANNNLIRLCDAWEESGYLYLQTELCASGNLDFFLSEFGAMAGNLDEPRLWKVLVELGTGVAYMHAWGVLHLDLKPANVFITGTGSLKIGDFGMATLWPRSSRSSSPVQQSVDTVVDSEGNLMEGTDFPIRRSTRRTNDPPSNLLAAAPRRRPKPLRQTTFEREGDREYIAPEVLSVGQYGPEADIFRYVFPPSPLSPLACSLMELVS